MASSTIPTTFLIISDTHNFTFSDPTLNPQPLQLPTPKTDVLLHSGDLTQIGGITSFKKALSMLSNITAELKLVIAGNHDLELDKPYWEAQCDEEGTPEDKDDHALAVEVMHGSLAEEAGVTFLNEGTHSFTLASGATFTIYVSPYTPAFGDWAFAYKHNEDRFNGAEQVAEGVVSIATNPIPENVDIVMTHGPPKGVLDFCPQGSVGCGNLLRAMRRVKPRMHCFGHIHEGNGGLAIGSNKSVSDQVVAGTEVGNPYPRALVWRVGKGESTLAVNAAIMDGDNKPTQSPWLVCLDLLAPT